MQANIVTNSPFHSVPTMPHIATTPSYYGPSPYTPVMPIQQTPVYYSQMNAIQAGQPVIMQPAYQPRSCCDDCCNGGDLCGCFAGLMLGLCICCCCEEICDCCECY